MEKKNLKAQSTEKKEVKKVATSKAAVKKPAVTKATLKAEDTKNVCISEVKEEKKELEVAKDVKSSHSKNTNNLPVNEFSTLRFIEKCSKLVEGMEFVSLDTKIAPDSHYVAVKYSVGEKECIYKVAYTKDNNRRIALHEDSVNRDIILPKHGNDAFNIQIYSTAFSEAVEDACVQAVVEFAKYIVKRANAAKEDRDKVDTEFKAVKKTTAEGICKALVTIKDDGRLKKGYCNGTDEKPADYQHLMNYLANN